MQCKITCIVLPVALALLVVALTLSDLSKYQDPLFPGVKIAKPDTCWFGFIPYQCDRVFTLGYAVWLGYQPAYVTVSHGLSDGDSIYQPCYYTCGGERTGYIGNVDNQPRYIEFRAVDCVNKFYGISFRYGS